MVNQQQEVNNILSTRPGDVWVECPHCRKGRWMRKYRIHKKNFTGLCYSCWVKSHIGAASPNWKGGRHLDINGYVLVSLSPNDFFHPMADNHNYVREHRLVVAKALGRCLHTWEIVHHKKGYAKDDNRYPETLQLVSELGHKQLTLLEQRITKLEEKVEEQNKVIKLLQWQNKQKEIHWKT